MITDEPINVVNPGRAPTNKPINKPMQIADNTDKKLPPLNNKGKEFKKLSNNIYLNNLITLTKSFLFEFHKKEKLAKIHA